MRCSTASVDVDAIEPGAGGSFALAQRKATALDTSALRLRLQTFLADRGMPGSVGELVPVVGGFSQITYAFTVHGPTEDRRYVLRSDRPGGAKLTTTDRALEFRVIQALNGQGAPVPTAHWADIDGSELGAPAMISEFVEGQNFLQAARVDARDHADLADLVADAAAKIHGLDSAGLPTELGSREGDWNAYIDSQVEAWRQMEARQAERMPVVRYLASWLDANRPPPVELCLVHGEFSLANLMLGPDSRISVIDWEYAHIGDPRMDFGWCIQRGGKEPPNVVADHIERVCRRYRELTGMSEEAMNPAAVSYFVILSGWRAFGPVLDSTTRFVNGESALLLSAYLISPWSLACSEWLRITDAHRTQAPQRNSVDEVGVGAES
jgi:aminoglycoside phosphotransferase (APT) family kinase protein